MTVEVLRLPIAPRRRRKRRIDLPANCLETTRVSSEALESPSSPWSASRVLHKPQHHEGKISKEASTQEALGSSQRSKRCPCVCSLPHLASGRIKMGRYVNQPARGRQGLGHRSWRHGPGRRTETGIVGVLLRVLRPLNQIPAFR